MDIYLPIVLYILHALCAVNILISFLAYFFFIFEERLNYSRNDSVNLDQFMSMRYRINHKFEIHNAKINLHMDVYFCFRVSSFHLQ